MALTDFSIILAGFGGQGILSAGRIVASAALIEGHEVSWFPSYGPEMRGGTANCGVVISDSTIGSPVINDTDVLIALNGPSLDKFTRQVKPGGLIIVDSTLVKAIPSRQDVRFFSIPASDLANELGNMNFAVVFLLGCLAANSDCISRASFEAALQEVLPARHHHLIPEELKVFDQGADFEPTDLMLSL
jgi:2-oxoglutarate ferredoxin oxidoreductase subunit gamma